RQGRGGHGRRRQRPGARRHLGEPTELSALNRSGRQDAAETIIAGGNRGRGGGRGGSSDHRAGSQQRGARRKGRSRQGRGGGADSSLPWQGGSSADGAGRGDADGIRLGASVGNR